MLVVTACDEAYAPHAATLIASIFDNEPEARVHLLGCGLSEETRARFDQLAEMNGRPITMLDPIPYLPDPFPEGGPISMLARCAIPDLFPDERRALYIDADCAVTGSLAGLWSTALGESLVGGVEDVDGGIHERRKGGVRSRFYINSGVLLMDLDRWRTAGVLAGMSRILQERRVLFFDQSALNEFAEGRITPLSQTWNHRPNAQSLRAPDSLPRIVHFSGVWRPWLHADYPFGWLYHRYRDRTPFRGPKPTRRYRSRLRRAVNLLVGRRRYRIIRDIERRFRPPE